MEHGRMDNIGELLSEVEVVPFFLSMEEGMPLI
jgi:hypothetical protein